MTEPKAPSAEERADAASAQCRNRYRHGLNFGDYGNLEICRECFATEIRAAESAATRKAWEEAAKWHEEEAAKSDAHADGLGIRRGDMLSPLRLAAVADRNCAIHFRSLAEREKGGE